MPLADVRPTDSAALEAIWDSVEREAGVLLEIYRGREGKTGPFAEGEVAGYADLMLACQIAFFQRFDTALFERFVGLGEGQFKALYEACLPWVEGQGVEVLWPGSGA